MDDLVTRQQNERRTRILDAARSLIAERGYDAVTMRDLADHGMVSVPTLYKLFGSKNELLFAAVESYFADLLGQGEVVQSNDGLARIISLADILGRETPRHAAYARSLMSFIGDVSDTTSGLNDLVAGRLSSELTGAIEEMQAKRQLVAWADPRPLAERLAGQISITTFAWACDQISDEGLRGTILYGTAVTLLGLARGRAAKDLEALVREHQGSAHAGIAACLQPLVTRSEGS